MMGFSLKPWRAGFAAAMVALFLGACAQVPTVPGELPPHSKLGDPKGTGSSRLAAQLQVIETESDANLAQGRLVLVAAGLNSRQPGFDGDVRLMDARLRAKFGDRYRSVLLSNVRMYGGERQWPLATIGHLDQVFDSLAQSLKPKDRLIVLLSAHGAQRVLEVEQEALYQTYPRYLLDSKIASWVDQFKALPT